MRRAGRVALLLCVALGMACQLAGQFMDDENTRVKDLRDKLEQKILTTCPDSMVNGDRENRLHNTLNVSFEFIEG